MIRSQLVSSRRLLASILAGAVLATAGCDSGPKVYPVIGKVVSKGPGNVKDLAGYSIQFQSTTDPKELPGGPIQADGTFTLYTKVGGKVIPGVKAGTYRACLVQYVPEGGAPPLMISRKYASFDTSQLQYEIAAGPNDLTIEVDRIGR
jgi:hypothetical protein